MRPFTTAVALSVGLVVLSGCSSIGGHEQVSDHVYPGVRNDAYCLSHPSEADIPCLQWMLVVDLPFSAVLDTLLWPFDASRLNHKSTLPVFDDGTNFDWKLVASIPDGYGGTNDYVLIPETKIRDVTNYQAAASAVAGARSTCFIAFWTNRANIPTSKWMDDKSMQTMTATYDRSEVPYLRLSCWLYPNREAAIRADAFVMPGVEMPKAAADTTK